jgi:hypothetical protein
LACPQLFESASSFQTLVGTYQTTRYNITENFKLQTKYKQRLLCVYFCQTHHEEKETFELQTHFFSEGNFEDISYGNSDEI